MPSNIGVKQIIRAFTSMTRKSLRNDHTDGANWYYHGNRIAWFVEGRLYFSLCGWDTVTTRARLNLLFRTLQLPMSLHRVKGDTVLTFEGKQSSIGTSEHYTTPYTV